MSQYSIILHLIFQEMLPMPKTIISDTSCFIVLTNIGELELLHKLYGRIITTLDIATEQQHRFGFFLFPKYILGEKQILTTNNKGGKRGFRVYADWDIPQSKQAEQTKNWQERYFINVADIENMNRENFNSIIYGVPNPCV